MESDSGPDRLVAEARFSHLNRTPVLTGVLLFVACAILYFISGAILVYSGITVTPNVLRIATIVVQIVAILLPAMLVARLQSGSVAAGLRLHAVRPSVVVAAVVGGLCIAWIGQLYTVVQELYLIPSDWMQTYFDMRARTTGVYTKLLASSDTTGLLLAFVTGSFAAGICEESLFRGVMQRNFESRLRPAAAVVLASLLFGLMHAQPANFVVLSMLGGFFGYVTWRTNSILPSVAAHAVFNGMMIAAMHVYSEMATQRRFSVDDLNATLPIAGVALAVLIFIIYWLNRNYGDAQPAHLDQ